MHMILSGEACVSVRLSLRTLVRRLVGVIVVLEDYDGPQGDLQNVEIQKSTGAMISRHPGAALPSFITGRPIRCAVSQRRRRSTDVRRHRGTYTYSWLFPIIRAPSVYEEVGDLCLSFLYETCSLPLPSPNLNPPLRRSSAVKAFELSRLAAHPWPTFLFL
jgi:hypothetical protein